MINGSKGGDYMAGFGSSIKLDGESEYQRALKQINQSLREVSSEMKVVSSSFDKNDKRHCQYVFNFLEKIYNNAIAHNFDLYLRA